MFSPPGLPDVAGPEKPGVPDERALHHPRERRPALASPRPAQRPRLPRRQRAALRRRAGGGALLGAGGGARDPQREGQRALRTGGVRTAASETKIQEAQIKLRRRFNDQMRRSRLVAAEVRYIYHLMTRRIITSFLTIRETTSRSNHVLDMLNG